MYLSERGATSISSCNLGKAKKAQTEKADKSNYWTFIQHKYKES